jgi:DNA ligase-1
VERTRAHTRTDSHARTEVRETHAADVMRYRVVADAYETLERAKGRIAMIAALADLFRRTPAPLLQDVTYLCQGKIAPDFAAVEIGLAEKLAARSVATATGAAEERVAISLRRTGDLGTAAEHLLGRQQPDRQPPLDVREVVEQFRAIATASGKGAQAHKITGLARLIRRSTPLEARYLVRTATGKLRLGVGDATILDALAEVYAGGRAHRPQLERAYNISSDLGLVASTVARDGLRGLERLEVHPGNPVRPMLAQRVSSAEEILTRLGACAAEYKYDGERVQIHRSNDEFTIFSRRLERITDQYPDAIELLRAGLGPAHAILEAEAVAIDPDSGDLRPFQELMHRRRKYGVEEAVRRYPVTLFVFDLLYSGEDLTRRPYTERRATLLRAITPSEHLMPAAQTIVATPKALQTFFEQAITDGCEGVMCKSVAPDAVYQAGTRGWLWIKYKRDYQTELQDTLDLVVVGALHGRGKRRGRYGALLLSAYDSSNGTFPTVTKVGTGFTDAQLDEILRRLEPSRTSQRPARVDSRMEPDVWFDPALVLEIVGAEITLSPIHTAGWGKAQEGAGLALRFPRFTGRFRDDKAPEDATTVQEIWDMYRRARRKASET